MTSSGKQEIPADWVLIAKITGPHGIRGAVKAQSYAETPELFQAGVRLRAETGAGMADELTVAWVKPHGRGIRLAFCEITDRSQAEALAGVGLFIRKSSLPELEEDTYYWYDLIGLAVVDSQGRQLGRLASILPTGSNDVYVVRPEHAGEEEEILIPALASVILEIDLEAGTMRVNLPEEA